MYVDECFVTCELFQRHLPMNIVWNIHFWNISEIFDKNLVFTWYINYLQNISEILQEYFGNIPAKFLKHFRNVANQHSKTLTADIEIFLQHFSNIAGILLQYSKRGLEYSRNIPGIFPPNREFYTIASYNLSSTSF